MKKSLKISGRQHFVLQGNKPGLTGDPYLRSVLIQSEPWKKTQKRHSKIENFLEKKIVENRDFLNFFFINYCFLSYT